MGERTHETSPGVSASPPPRGWMVRAAAVVLVLTVIGVATGFWVMNRHPGPVTPAPASADPPKSDGNTKVGGAPLFAGWPAGQAPDVVLVLTGQTYGYVSPCGCSRPQKGGLERRYNFMQGLRSRGWYVVGLDLGDVAPASGKVHKQDLLKYRYTMRALAEMGYAAVGLGEYDFAAQLFELLSEYTLNNAGKPPIVLGANVAGVAGRNPDGQVAKVLPREQLFPPAVAGGRPMVEAFEVVTAEGRPAIGVVAVVGPDAAAKAEKADTSFTFLNNNDVLKAAKDALDRHPARPQLRVLMYGDKLDKAKLAAQAFPEYQVILCQSDDPEPPQFPVMVNDNRTAIVQVGHKGQNLGALAVYKKGDGFELKYQLVPLGEEYLTPPDPQAAKENKVLQLLEEYTLEVKKQNLLALFTARPLQHPAQIQNPNANLTFVGSEACRNCHPGEYKQYAETKHSHAYDALEKIAKRPENRQFDGECIVCHTVGFEYQGGYKNAAATPHLKHVGCENCHGPGSGHAANPADARLKLLMSPWKTKPEDKLPSKALLEELAKKKPLDRGSVKVPPDQAQVMSTVRGMCMKCHDHENDPKFDFEAYMPHVYHSGMKAAGLPPGAK